MFLFYLQNPDWLCWSDNHPGQSHKSQFVFSSKPNLSINFNLQQREFWGENLILVWLLTANFGHISKTGSQEVPVSWRLKGEIGFVINNFWISNQSFCIGSGELGRRQKLVSIIFQISLLFNFPICIRYIIPGGWVGGEEQWSLNSGEILCDGKVEELETTWSKLFCQRRTTSTIRLLVMANRIN